eukprot:372289_1
MDDLQQNAIRIKDSKDLYPKTALRWYIKSKRYYIFDSHHDKWKRLQLDCEWKLMIKIHTFSLRFFRPTEYEPDYNQNFGQTKYFAIYAAKTNSIILGVSVLFRGIIHTIMKNVHKQYEREYNTYNIETI